MQVRNSYTSSFRCRAILLAKCALIAIALAAVWWFATPIFQDRYPAVLADKFDRLKAISGPKIVVIGNSNVAFGINSKILEETFGMPAVNAGLHAGFSGEFLERMALVNTVPGDIYVLCHPRFNDGYRTTIPSYLLMAMGKNWRLYSMIRRNEWLSLAHGLPGYFRAAIDDFAKCASLKAEGSDSSSAKKTAYSRSAFDADGNNIFRREARYTAIETITPPNIVTPETIERINTLYRLLRSKGAFLTIAGFPVAEGPKTASREEFSAFSRRLQENLECPVISDLGDYIMPRNLFFDNSMHLTIEGADVRTKQLAKDLTVWAAAHPETGLSSR